MRVVCTQTSASTQLRSNDNHARRLDTSTFNVFTGTLKSLPPDSAYELAFEPSCVKHTNTITIIFVHSHTW